MSNDATVAQLGLAVGLLLPRQGVLHPVLVVTLGVVLARVRASRLLAVGSGLSRLDGAGQQVTELERLNEVGVPDHAAVLDANVGELGVDLVDLADTLIKGLLSTEDGDIGLHDLLHLEADIGGRLGAVGGADLVDDGDRLGTGVGGDRVRLLAGREVVADGVGNGTAEDDEIEEGVGTQAVSTVDGHAGGLTAGEETGDNLVLAVLVDSEDLTSVLGGDTTHVVVDGGQNGDGLLGDIDTGENGGRLRDTGQTVVEDLSGQMAKLEVDVVLLGANTAALADLHGHGTGDDIAGGQILGSGGITLHKALTLGVQQVATLTTRALSDQAAGAVDTGRMELDELEILVGETGAGNHGHTVTCAGVGGCAGEVGAAVTTGSQDGVLGDEPVDGAVLLVVGNDTLADAVLHDQISSEELDEVLGVVAQRLAVESVQESVAGTVSSSAAAVGLATLAVLLGLTTESTLVAVSCQ